MLIEKKVFQMDRNVLLRLFVDEGIVKNDVHPIRRGDIVTKINGYDISYMNWAELVGRLSYHTENASLEIVRKTRLGRFLALFACLKIRLSKKRGIHESLVGRL